MTASLSSRRLGWLLLAAVAVCVAGRARADLFTDSMVELMATNGAPRPAAEGEVPGWTTSPASDADAGTLDTISRTVTGLRVGPRYRLDWTDTGASHQRTIAMFHAVLMRQSVFGGTGTPAWGGAFALVTAGGTKEVLGAGALTVGVASSGNELDAVTLGPAAP